MCAAIIRFGWFPRDYYLPAAAIQHLDHRAPSSSCIFHPPARTITIIIFPANRVARCKHVLLSFLFPLCVSLGWHAQWDSTYMMRSSGHPSSSHLRSVAAAVDPAAVERWPNSRAHLRSTADIARTAVCYTWRAFNVRKRDQMLRRRLDKWLCDGRGVAFEDNKYFGVFLNW
jgi:hypothetical protein